MCERVCERECVCVSVHNRLLVSWVWVVWVSVCSLCERERERVWVGESECVLACIRYIYISTLHSKLGVGGVGGVGGVCSLCVRVCV